jgi:ribose/xylose/arabinose/galactoside ABC-type transport system permease subunit
MIMAVAMGVPVSMPVMMMVVVRHLWTLEHDRFGRNRAAVPAEA